MKARHSFTFFILIFITAFLLLFSSELSLLEQVKKVVFRSPQIDTIGHFIGFFILAWLVHSLIKLSLLDTFITLSVYGALSEIGQYYLGFRNGEFSDFFADVAGISFFLLLKIAYLFYKNKLFKYQVDTHLNSSTATKLD